ncbi:hypothetical protein PUN28_016581 [Cardiocondyla obscurior]|uniref:Uncharacterized protein n=1 Tax=Cardiocondyla obscurior TaxID=286306 RepID=A0AAW2ESP8_9HYME
MSSLPSQRVEERKRKRGRYPCPAYTYHDYTLHPVHQRDRYTQPLKRPRCAAPAADNTPTIIAKPTERFASAYTRGEHAIPPHASSFHPVRNERCLDAARVHPRWEKVFLHRRRSAESSWWLNQRQTTLEGTGPIAERGGVDAQTRKG